MSLTTFNTGIRLTWVWCVGRTSDPLPPHVLRNCNRNNYTATWKATPFHLVLAYAINEWFSGFSGVKSSSDEDLTPENRKNVGECP